MNIRIFQILIWVLLFLNRAKAQSTYLKTKIILDFLNTLDNPLPVNVLLCWKPAELRQISQELWKNEFAVRISSTEFPWNVLNNASQVFLLDSSCPNSKIDLDQAESRVLFKPPYIWILFQDSRIKINYEKYSLLPDSEFYIIDEEYSKTELTIYQKPSSETLLNLNKNNENNSLDTTGIIETTLNKNAFNIKAVYKVGQNATKYLENNITKWVFKQGFLYFNKLILGLNRTDLHNVTLNITYVITNLDSLNHMWDYRNPHVDNVSKLPYILLHIVIRILNINGNFVMTRTWGYKNETTGTFNGLLGDMKEGLTEIGELNTDLMRFEHVDYVGAARRVEIGFLLRSPSLSMVQNVLLLPFHPIVWYSIFIILAFAFIVIYGISYWEWNTPTFMDQVTDERGMLRPEVGEVLLLGTASLCQQGSTNLPRSVSGMILSICLSLFLMFLYTSYSANVVALLQSTSGSINTLEDLLASRIQCGAEDIVYTIPILKIIGEKNPTVKKLHEQKITPPNKRSNLLPAEEGIRKMRNEFFAFHIDATTGFTIISNTFFEHEKCHLKIIPFIKANPYFCVRKRSAYKELLKVGIARLHEYGIVSREAQKFMKGPPVCQGRESSFGSVGLLDCYFPCLIFLAAVIIALLLLALENYISMNIRHRKNMSK